MPVNFCLIKYQRLCLRSFSRLRLCLSALLCSAIASVLSVSIMTAYLILCLSSCGGALICFTASALLLWRIFTVLALFRIKKLLKNLLTCHILYSWYDRCYFSTVYRYGYLPAVLCRRSAKPATNTPCWN